MVSIVIIPLVLLGLIQSYSQPPHNKKKIFTLFHYPPPPTNECYEGEENNKATAKRS